ncbi:replication initiation protein [Vibrio parahaemolyticus]|uniref:replication initiation protein n=1 Tax=Vibrio parahaemolyticus TaxID=670 RepID=UPI00226B90FD|nr:replication initiation protein [Vibrio parahaemolyticus]MCX8941282.1 replication initiation protein [Vibrio parahaemolyticus]
MKTEKVLKPHHAITARVVFTGREQDLMTLAYRAVKKEYDRIVFSGQSFHWTDFKSEYNFTAEELMDLFSLSKQGLYDAIDASTDGIMNKTVVMKFPDEKSFDKVNLIRRARFRDGVLTLKLEEELIRYFVDYSKGFSEIDLRLLLSLDGVKGFDKRILELISRFKNEKEYSLTIGELSQMLGQNLSDYARAQNFFLSALDRPIKRIVKQSDGIWTTKKGFPKGYVVKKSGRSYKDIDVITFKMKYNEPEAIVEAKVRDYNNMTMDELEAIFVEFVYSDVTEVIPKEVFIAFSNKSMSHMSSFGEMTKALEWMTKANELKDAAVMKYVKLANELPFDLGGE